MTTLLVSIIYPLTHLSLALSEWVLISWAIRLWQQSTSLAMMLTEKLFSGMLHKVSKAKPPKFYAVAQSGRL